MWSYCKRVGHEATQFYCASQLRGRDVAVHRARTETCWENVPVCTENLNPDVVVMKSAKDRV